jgi:4-hydroxy-tetrahydrodipicolinate reductase
VSAEVLRVAVIGSHGRLGGVLARAIDAAGDLQLVAKLGRDTPRALLAQSGAQVALEVTGPTSVLANVRTCLDAGVSVVVGASGLAAEDLADLRTRLADSPELGVLVAPNFSVGAVLAEALAVRAAAHLGSVEILELHHDQKVDAPSGTARRTAARIAAARAAAGFGAIPDATTQDPDGARGAEIHGIHVHSIRLPGLVAHQEVLFGGTGETLSIRHDSTSRDSFVSGALLALRRVLSLPGLTVGLETLLGLAAAEPEPAR